MGWNYSKDDLQLARSPVNRWEVRVSEAEEKLTTAQSRLDDARYTLKNIEDEIAKREEPK